MQRLVGRPANHSLATLATIKAMIQVLYLGRLSYPAALLLQAEVAALRLAGRVENVLLLLEHPPVLTLGRNANRANILASDELLASRGVSIHEINRGGDVTYHGPGQLVGYPIFDLRSLRSPEGARIGPVDFVRRIEEALIRTCAVYGVQAGRLPGLTGVWCAENTHSSQPTPAGERKIAAIGIHVARGITSHGFAFNLTTNLSDFSLIVPCGIRDHAVTSLENEISNPAQLPSLEELAQQAARHFGLVLNEEILAVDSLDALRNQDNQIFPPADKTQNFPASDTPLTRPAEFDQLHHKPEPPQPC
jgi:lipoyl(octanoyl) transferase